jgi:hypothetical protein
VSAATGLTDDQYQRVRAIVRGDRDGIDTLQTAVELHQLAWNWNWDDLQDVPRQIIRHPLCDRGTALLIYWRAAPRWYYQFANRDEVASKHAWSLPHYDLVKEIEERYVAGGYSQGEIAFDPSNDEGIDWIAEYEDEESKQLIPDIMNEPSPGRRLDRGHF